MLQNFILNTVSDWFKDNKLTNGSFRYKLRGKRLRKGPKQFGFVHLYVVEIYKNNQHVNNSQ